MKRIPQSLLFALLLLLALGAQAQLSADDDDDRRPPSLMVTGRGETFATPNRAVLRVGAVVQDAKAAPAQKRINEIMQQALKNIAALNIPKEKIQTAQLTLQPVYEQPRPEDTSGRQRIIAYRAANTLQITLDDLGKIGPAIDTAVSAGANNIENIAFDLSNDTPHRQEALRKAVEEARAKADTMAKAMNVKLKQVDEVTEGGVSIMQPRMAFGEFAMAKAEAATPVQPGQIHIEATVTVRYRIE